MKIALTGGGTGGHFYPLIAIAEELRKQADEQKIVSIDLVFLAPSPYNERLLFENGIKFVHVPSGKRRPYFSILNYLDAFKVIWGCIVALWKLFWIYPDVLVGKGGYASFPSLFAARILGIPILIHESDTVPGKVNKWAGKFANRVAVSYPETVDFFPKEKTAWTGQPIRRAIQKPTKVGAHEFLHLEKGIPVILVLGGSQGSMAINDCVVDMLDEALPHFQVIHQVGKDNIPATIGRANFLLKNNILKNRYIGFGYLNDTALSMSAGAADLIISRAGSTIFEIAAWGIPSIIVPIPGDISHDQEHNALAYARSGSSILLKQENLTSHVLLSEILRVLNNKPLHDDLAARARAWGKPNAGTTIANEILKIGLSHESK